MTKQNRRLGKGLGALLDVDNELISTGEGSRLLELDILEIDVDKNQPRKEFDQDKLKELAESIKEHGIIQPIIVRKSGERYIIIAGERRFRAARSAGMEKVPVIIRDDVDIRSLELSLIENIQRENLNPIEEARAIERLISEYGYTQSEAAERLSKSRSALANSLRLLTLSEKIQEDLYRGRLTSGHARAILMIEDKGKQEEAAKVIVEKQLSVRQSEELAKLMNSSKRSSIKRKLPEFIEAEGLLSKAFDTRVLIKGNENKGKIQIEYRSAEQLRDLYEMLLSNQ